MLKRITLLIVILLLCTLLALWSPWMGLKIDLKGLFGVKSADQIAGIQVYSLAGDMDIFIDGNKIGSVNPDKSPFYYDTVTPGERLITLTRKSKDIGDYWQFSKILNFEQGNSIVLSFYLGPSEEFSEGHFIIASKKDDLKRKSKINFTINTDGADIKIESLELQKFSNNKFSAEIDFTNQKDIVISKLGYEPLEFKILPDKQEDRDRLKDFDLNIDAKLMLQPVKVE